jgi:RNA polymerase sigma factor (sigma-70 family)
LVLTADADRKAHARAVEAGAAGVLHKTVSISDVVDGVRHLLAGESLLSQNETVELLRLADRDREQNKEAQRAISSLTPREREVLQALTDGLSDKEIAECLYVSSGTVRNHVISILRKLNVHSRLQALVFAVRHGAVEID